ncbi:uncharacterized protein KY384_000544 [Bacidia gigantensis]|uniref:uncharacterized protein n=1 Tax=Bacidia gigantensis TaxID=2732470 RepID=UPI001D03A7B6|nr:uncharacterized protein KY384_000544 [Bacidia gigantensis]KAG8525784.1 hypothetical protein KY384_000544 [Bacidia gigantensis]
MYLVLIIQLLLAAIRTAAIRYDPEHILWNLNQNKTATSPVDYWGQWDNHSESRLSQFVIEPSDNISDFTPSPDNWRFPVYTIILDRFVNGDPSNDNTNGTAWEQDLYGTQLRHGGDIKGLQDTLDYLEGMGVKGIYIAGSPFINLPWGADAYSPLDLTLLDAHFATIDVWRDCIDEIHSRGMYVILDNTMATLGDLIGFEGSLNVSTPLNYHEYNAMWKTSRRYHDFTFDNYEVDKCDTPYPRFYDDFGEEVSMNGTEHLIGCRQSEFDQYGDIAAFDVYPEWQRQLSKFASVQDRLREWKPSVREKIELFTCMQISMLDIDGIRMDKGQQITVDAQGDFADATRRCAKRFNKSNFFIPGEIVSGNAFGSVYLGRGKTPEMAVNDTDKAIRLTTDAASDSLFTRAKGKNAFDAACFHYSTYRALLRFLGMDGNIGANSETPVDFVDAWNDFIKTNDFINANTGNFDPRHMFGAQNQDNFRWPTIVDGTQKQLLGNFITTLLLPGIPLLEWGEEQAFYVHDNTAPNYVFGRQAMSATTAWQDHGCYTVGNNKFATWPPGNYSKGCEDDWNSLDHRDPSHPVRNLMMSMFEMRRRFPVLNDGFKLQTITKRTHPILLPGSLGTDTETGLWSFDCTHGDTGLLAPFPGNTRVKNLLYPYEEILLETTSSKLTLDQKTSVDGCLSKYTMPPWGYKAYVPFEQWLRPSPVVTKFNPGHDYRILSKAPTSSTQTIPVEFWFSDEMDCDSVLNGLKCDSNTETGLTATFDKSNFRCHSEVDDTVNVSEFAGIVTGQMPGLWKIAGNLVNVSDGVHTLTVGNVTNQVKNASTNAINHFLLRVGSEQNPMVFPRSANYSKTLLYRNADDSLHVSHTAAGADMFRYSLNWASSWSEWQPYKGGNTTLEPQHWSGTHQQAWSGDHVQIEYWSKKTGALVIQQGDRADSDKIPRRFPHIFLHGRWNQYGYDSGLNHNMKQDKDGLWKFNLMTDYPSEFQVNVWGSNPDGQPDLSRAYGDVNVDGVLDLISPVSLLKNVVNITNPRRHGSLGYRIHVDDATLKYTTIPIGSDRIQACLLALLAVLPIITGVICVLLYQRSFYDIKFNRLGKREKTPFLPIAMKEKMHFDQWASPGAWAIMKKTQPDSAASPPAQPRRTVLIATMEYNIEDWDIKIKIGGLGVMSQLMGQHLGHINLIWVVPCVEDIQYPVDQQARPVKCMIMGNEYTIQVQYHHVRNITYVLLDAPVFRQQTKAEPYPKRMDDIDSAIYYSAWNYCIAEILQRFPVDLYHINDYHGAAAPLHLLPKVIPCCLSLHNAEFQGLWPMRTSLEFEEVCRVYNLPADIVRSYIQFGGVFNLLHAGASYLRMHQSGYGAAGVSTKYGKRSFARYPVLWGLKKVMGLPNPDPTDVEAVATSSTNANDVVVDEVFEAGRSQHKQQAQKWAGLNQDPEAELFVFVGRWSTQKGIDLVADVFPSILEQHPKAQLICVGPVIDLYGRFAALKLEKLMELYPRRVFSKPEFTALPPFIFSGAEFALIPSRDEPFGLVAVEFGRKGALGIGARVGGLGNMPG